MKIRIVQGDITTVEVDAIVNAANSSLMGGGGVDGAIHRAAGPVLLAECMAIRDRKGPCPTGQVVATGAGRLKARHVLHAVGPIWSNGTQGEDQLLKDCYRNALALAASLGCRSIAFPAISTGIFGFPADRAVRCVAEVMVDAATDPALKRMETVLLVAFGPEQFALYRRHFDQDVETTSPPTSRIRSFLDGSGMDNRGRTLDDILAFSDQQLESVHDYIQWLFPLTEPSRFNPFAPLLDQETILEIRKDPDSLSNLYRSLVRMLAFYEVNSHWASPWDHNLLRITRILGCCRILLGSEIASDTLVRIKERCAVLGFDPGSETIGFWDRAIQD
jgi:O-acetyl-ADP-ribose deacetylase (regulator of RNase III)